MSNPYREDLALIHDMGFGGVAARAAEVLIDGLRERGLAGGLVVDLGCGSGILSAAVLAAGYRVLGVDLSEAMIELARGRAPAGEFRVESLLRTPLPECVGVAIVGEGINYLFDPDCSMARVHDLFDRIFKALSPGGLLVLDAAGPGRVAGGETGRRAVEADGWAVLFGADESAEGILTRKITTFRQIGELYRRDEEIHTQWLIEPGILREWLKEAGFEVRDLVGYGEERYPSGVSGFAAMKPD